MTSLDLSLYAWENECSCFECNLPIIVYETIVWCDFCSKKRHRTCTDFTLEEYCRQFECGRWLLYACRTCTGSHKVATEYNAMKIMKERQKANPDAIPDTKLAIIAGDDEEYESGSDEELDRYTDSEEEFEEIVEDYPVTPEVLQKAVLKEKPVEFTIAEKKTKAGYPVLEGSDGYSYILSKAKGMDDNTTLWKCRTGHRGISSYGPTGKCCATVTQTGHTFTRGWFEHRHYHRFSLADHMEYLKEEKKERKEKEEKEAEERFTEADMSDQSDTEDGEDLISEADMEMENEDTSFNSHSSFVNAMTQTDFRNVETTANNRKDLADATTQTDVVNGEAARSELMGTDAPTEIGTSGSGRLLPSIMDVEANPGRSNGYYYFHTTKIVYWRSTETSEPTLIRREDTMIKNSVPSFNLRQLESETATSTLQNTETNSPLPNPEEQTEGIFDETKDPINIKIPETCNRIAPGNRKSQSAAHQTEDVSTDTHPSPPSPQRKSDKKRKRTHRTEIPNSTPPQEMNNRKSRRRVNKHVCPYC